VPDEVPLDPDVFASAPLLVGELVDELPIELLPDVDPPALEPLEAANAGAVASINAETATAILVVFIGFLQF
jgi:hypothetical protein